MPDTSSTSIQKTNDFFRTAFIVLLSIVMLTLSFLAGMVVQREFLGNNRVNQANNSQNASLTPTDSQSPTTTSSITPSVTITPTSTTQSSETRKTYTNNKYGFSMLYPSAWAVKEETNSKCSQNASGTHICQYVTFENPNNKLAALRVEVTSTADLGVLTNLANIETNYKEYQKQTSELQFNGNKLDRTLLIKDSTIKFVCFIPSGYQCGKGVIPVQNLSVQFWVGNSTGVTSSESYISPADVTVIDTIIQSFKKI